MIEADKQWQNTDENPGLENFEAELEVSDMTIEAEGISACMDENGKRQVYFLPGFVPGDRVLIRGRKREKQVFRALQSNLISASPNRQEPFCPIFERCGGCLIQTLNYDGGLKWKRLHVENLLQRVGGLKDVKVNDCLGMEEPYGFRNIVRFWIEGEGKDLEIGFREPRSHRLVSAAGCRIINSHFEKMREGVKNILCETAFKGAEQLLLRQNSAQNSLLVSLQLRSGTPNTQALQGVLNRIEKWAITELPELKLSLYSSRTRPGGAEAFRHHSGAVNLRDEVLGLQFEISPQSFFQTNLRQNEVLFNEVLSAAREAVKLKGQSPLQIADLFCGTGSLTMLMAREYPNAKVRGVEIVPETVSDARINAELNGLAKISFEAGLAENWSVGDLAYDLVLMDPPRQGLNPRLCESLLASGASALIYVSCNPATLARDLKLLSPGYVVRSVQPVDMFPWTTHVEVLVRLSRA